MCKHCPSKLTLEEQKELHKKQQIDAIMSDPHYGTLSLPYLCDGGIWSDEPGAWLPCVNGAKCSMCQFHITRLHWLQRIKPCQGYEKRYRGFKECKWMFEGEGEGEGKEGKGEEAVGEGVEEGKKGGAKGFDGEEGEEGVRNDGYWAEGADWENSARARIERLIKQIRDS